MTQLEILNEYKRKTSELHLQRKCRKITEEQEIAGLANVRIWRDKEQGIKGRTFDEYVDELKSLRNMNKLLLKKRGNELL